MGKNIGAVLRILCLSLQDLADELGLSYDTVRGWSARKTEPSPENRAALAAFIRRHAKRLEARAASLEE